jgi:hypothetical protein
VGRTAVLTGLSSVHGFIRQLIADGVAISKAWRKKEVLSLFHNGNV